MEIQLKIIDGEMQDIAIIKNILNNHDVRTKEYTEKLDNDSMGLEIIPALVIVLPEVTQFVRAVIPAIQTYFETQKPSGTKNKVELSNGEKKIYIESEKGEKIEVEQILEFCNKTKFFE